MITYLVLPIDMTYRLDHYTESIVHKFYSTGKTYVMFDVRGLSAGLNFLDANEITQERYWEAYGKNKPILKWNASPFLENSTVKYKITLTESYLFEILKATGAITKNHYKIYASKDANGLILQSPEPMMISLKSNAILTEKEYRILTQVLLDMKPEILMTYDWALREVYAASLLENDFIL